MIPGEYRFATGAVALFAPSETIRLSVLNTADRPIQVGSHYHFAEANPALAFDREAAWGRRLAIAAGTSVRFEPGVEREVGLIEIRGRRVVPGLRRGVGGPLDARGQGNIPSTDKGGTRG